MENSLISSLIICVLLLIISLYLQHTIFTNKKDNLLYLLIILSIHIGLFNTMLCWIQTILNDDTLYVFIYLLTVVQVALFAAIYELHISDHYFAIVMQVSYSDLQVYDNNYTTMIVPCSKTRIIMSLLVFGIISTPLIAIIFFILL